MKKLDAAVRYQFAMFTACFWWKVWIEDLFGDFSQSCNTFVCTRTRNGPTSIRKQQIEISQNKTLRFIENAILLDSTGRREEEGLFFESFVDVENISIYYMTRRIVSGNNMPREYLGNKEKTIGTFL